MNITEVTRRDIIDYLITNGISFSGRLDELEFLGRIWDLHSMPSTDSRFDDGYWDIWQHRINNNDWDDHYFLGTYLKLFKCADEIFLKFLETCLHPIVRPNENEASEFVSVFNELLARDGYVLNEVSSISARAVYKGMRLKEGVHGNVKNLIFAANGPKQHSLMKDSNSMADFKSNRTKAFISYSHKDSKFLTELQAHLGYFVRDRRIDFWDDTKITPGSKWREEIRAAIESAKVAVLLVSADFLNSEFIAKNELPPLLAAAEHEGATILPVIIRPCVFTSTNLKQFQAVNDPSEPLSKMKKYRREEEWTKIAKLVEAALNAQETGIVPSNATGSRREPKTPTSSEPYLNADNELLLRVGLSTHVEPRKTKEEYINEGLQHHKAKRYKEALAAYNHALELDPTNPYIYGRRANTYRALREYERALQDFNRAFELDPESATAWAYATRGRVYDGMKQYQKALGDFDHAYQLDPTSTWVERWRNETIEKLKKQGEKH